MLLLHLSDIHFRNPVCRTPALDLDHPLRTRLVQSIASELEQLGPVNAMLFTGDIAFAGDPIEYDTATRWIVDELAPAARCDPTDSYMVPGNHDQNRILIRREMAIRNVLDAICSASLDRRETVLRAQIANASTGRSLFEPLAAYNDFAARFNCQVYAPDRLYWRHELDLGAGVRLRLYGLTSTLLSGAVRGDGNQNDRIPELYLSPLQTHVVDPSDDVVNLIMAHHPPNWCMDHDEIEAIFADRAALHLFGHRHQSRVQRERHFMRFDAGALHPDRHVNGWRPCYNLIRLDVIGTGAERTLAIRAKLMEWQTNPEGFKPRKDGSSDMFQHFIPIPARGTTTAAPVAPASPALIVPPTNLAEPAIAVTERRARNLLMRFFDLPSSQRFRIALGLGLITEAERSVPEPERYSKAFRRASEQGLFEQLDEEVRKCQKT